MTASEKTIAAAGTLEIQVAVLAERVKALTDRIGDVNTLCVTVAKHDTRLSVLEEQMTEICESLKLFKRSAVMVLFFIGTPVWGTFVVRALPEIIKWLARTF
jgi:hypothetical protein